MKKALKIVSWNVNGIRASAPKGLLDFVETENPDILCLQETKAHIEQVEPILKDLGYKFANWSSATKKGYSGTATFSNQAPLEVFLGIGKKEYDSEGRFVISRFQDFDVYNIYFPNGGSGEERHNFKQQFLVDLLEHLKNEINRGRSIVLLGDYNIAHQTVDVHDPVRLSKESGFLPEERAWLDQFFAAGFIDSFRHFHPGEKDRYSWWSYRELARPRNRGWRIDYISVSQGLKSRMKSANILDQVQGSDHCPVILELE